MGVASEGFAGLDSWPTDLWLPTTTEPLFEEDTVYHLVGRLAPGSHVPGLRPIFSVFRSICPNSTADTRRLDMNGFAAGLRIDMWCF